MVNTRKRQTYIAERDELEQLAQNLAAMYGRAQTELQEQLARQLRDWKPEEMGRVALLSNMRDAAEQQARTLRALSDDSVYDLLVQAETHGHEAALRDLAALSTTRDLAVIPPSSRVKTATVLPVYPGPYTTALRQEGVRRALGSNPAAVALTASLSAARQGIVRWADDVYREATATASQSLLLGLATQRTAQQAAWRKLVAKGVTGFTDKRGRKWNLASYVEMASRTAVRRAWEQQHTETMVQAGVELVTIAVGNGACEACSSVSGKIWSIDDDGEVGDVQVESALTGTKGKVKVAGTLDDAKSQGWHHPNCRCRPVAYIPGLSAVSDETTYDPEAEAARAKLRDLERRTRAAKLEAQTAPSPAAKREAEARARALQADIRAHVTATGVTRQPHRERLDLGHKLTDAPPPVKPKAVAPPKAPTYQPAPAAPASAKPKPLPKQLGTVKSKIDAWRKIPYTSYNDRIHGATDIRKEQVVLAAMTARARSGRTPARTFEGVHKGPPMSIDEARSGANPEYTTNQYDVNCMHVTQAYELRRRGYQVEATPLPDSMGKKGCNFLGTLHSNFLGAKYVPTPTRRALEAEVKSWGDGGRGIIRVGWKGGGTGHVYNVENVKGKVVYVEGQNIKSDATHYYDDVGTVGGKKNMGVVRTDQLALNGDNALQASDPVVRISTLDTPPADGS